MDLEGQALLDYVAQQKQQGRRQSDIAAEWGIGLSTLENSLTQARREAAGLRRAQEAKDRQLFQVDIGQAWELEGDFMVVGDVHIPCTDYDLALRVAAIARAQLSEPRRLIVAGDFWNFDAWSRYPPVITPPAWKQEREAARALVRAWRDTFAQIYFISGNHDWRRIVANNAVEDAEDLVDLLKSSGVAWSVYKWCTVKSGNACWRITHPRNFSQVNLSVAERLVNRFQTNLLSFHEHHLGEAIDRVSGRWVIANGGCLVDPRKLAYVQLEDRAGSVMVQGFAMLRNGIVTLFGNGMTDWSEYERN